MRAVANRRDDRDRRMTSDGLGDVGQRGQRPALCLVVVVVGQPGGRGQGVVLGAPGGVTFLVGDEVPVRQRQSGSRRGQRQRQRRVSRGALEEVSPGPEPVPGALGVVLAVAIDAEQVVRADLRQPGLLQEEHEGRDPGAVPFPVVPHVRARLVQRVRRQIPAVTGAQVVQDGGTAAGERQPRLQLVPVAGRTALDDSSSRSPRTTCTAPSTRRTVALPRSVRRPILEADRRAAPRTSGVFTADHRFRAAAGSGPGFGRCTPGLRRRPRDGPVRGWPGSGRCPSGRGRPAEPRSW